MPIQGETLTTAKGTVWLVEAVNGTDPDDINEPDYDPAFFVVDMVISQGSQDTVGVNIQLDNTAFEQFCKDEGIVLA